MTLIFILLFFLYLLFAGAMIFAWNRCDSTSTSSEYQPLLSIVIAARNESQTIGRIVEDIREQTHKNFEVIIVDDHSTDKTSDIVQNLAAYDSRFSLVRNTGEGKKAALTTGIRLSKGEIIVTTDADCRMKVRWLETLTSHFQRQATKFVFGGVKIEGSSFFSKMQAHEFLSLVGTAAATLWWGFPSMCNGANLAFRKSAFVEVGGYENNFHIPSGDDEFLMHKIFHRYSDGVRFVFSQQAVVSTSSVVLREFIHQRIRWAGKWSHNLSLRNIILATFIFFFQVSVIALPVAALSGSVNPYLAGTLFLLKAGLEYVFLKKVARFLEVPWSLPAFFALQIVYPLYAVSIAVISSSFSFEWKGRTLKSFTISTVKK